MAGTMAEAYDFALYGASAGLIFPRLFFGTLPPETGAMLAFAILLGGYAARPLGGVVFGHFGDKYGRRSVLFATLITMGAATFLMGLLPTTDQIGVIAPIILVALRVVQGLAYGGEWAGATLMSMEHSPKNQRGLGASIAAMGGPAGSLMAALVLGIVSMLPEEQLFAWGWRLPFILSIFVVAFGLWLRLGVEESPEFQEVDTKAIKEPAPILRVLTAYPRQVIVGVMVGTGTLFVQGLIAAYMIPYLVGRGDIDRTTALMLFSLSSALQIFAVPFFAALSDKVGRKRWLISANAASLVLIWPVFVLFNSRSIPLIGLAFVLGNVLIVCATYGPFGAYLGEKFEVRSRYTGVSLSYQLAAIFGAGMAPALAEAIVGKGSTTPVVLLISALFAVASLATAKGSNGNKTNEPALENKDEPALENN
jgi:MFS family permease